MQDIDTPQNRHEMLIDFLSQFKQYQYDGKPMFKKIKKQVNLNKIQNIDTNDINGAAVVFRDILNLEGGSLGNMDIYELLQVYLTIPEYRDKINDIVREAKKYKYNKNK